MIALYFKAIVDQVIAGVIKPIIAAIFGKSQFTDIGFDIVEITDPLAPATVGRFVGTETGNPQNNLTQEIRLQSNDPDARTPGAIRFSVANASPVVNVLRFFHEG